MHNHHAWPELVNCLRLKLKVQQPRAAFPAGGQADAQANPANMLCCSDATDAALAAAAGWAADPATEPPLIRHYVFQVRTSVMQAHAPACSKQLPVGGLRCPGPCPHVVTVCSRCTCLAPKHMRWRLPPGRQTLPPNATLCGDGTCQVRPGICVGSCQSGGRLCR